MAKDSKTQTTRETRSSYVFTEPLDPIIPYSKPLHLGPGGTVNKISMITGREKKGRDEKITPS